jgi:hypothetical protein
VVAIDHVICYLGYMLGNPFMLPVAHIFAFDQCIKVHKVLNDGERSPCKFEVGISLIPFCREIEGIP